MEGFFYFLRNTISGPVYFIYALIGYMFIFAIIGYLYKGKYTKFAFATSMAKTNDSNKIISKENKDVKESEPVIIVKKENNVQAQAATPVINNSIAAVIPNIPEQPVPQVVQPASQPVQSVQNVQSNPIPSSAQVASTVQVSAPQPVQIPIPEIK